MKLLIVNADDFGESHEINQAIIKTFKQGIVRSASILTDMPGTKEAVRFAKANPQFGFGIHLNLDRFFLPKLHKAVHLKKSVTAEQVITAAEQQIEKLLTTGIPFDHIDGHHHCIMRPTLFPLLCELAEKYSIPAIRYAPGLLKRFDYVDAEFLPVYANRHNIKHTQFFITHSGEFEKIVNMKTFTAEFMVHPGIYKKNKWWIDYWRMQDLSLCTDVRIKTFLKKQNIKLGKFSDLK